MPTSEELKIFEGKHCISILLALRDGSLSKTELYNAVSKNPRMPEKLASLSGIGLLTVTRVDNRVDIVALTDKGAEAADLLDRMDALIRSPDPAPSS